MARRSVFVNNSDTSKIHNPSKGAESAGCIPWVVPLPSLRGTKKSECKNPLLKMCLCPGRGKNTQKGQPNVYCSPPDQGTIVSHRLGIFFPCRSIDNTCTTHWNATASTKHLWCILEPTIGTCPVGIRLRLQSNSGLFVGGLFLALK